MRLVCYLISIKHTIVIDPYSTVSLGFRRVFGRKQLNRMSSRGCVAALFLAFVCIAGATELLQPSSEHFIVSVAQLQVRPGPRAGALYIGICPHVTERRDNHFVAAFNVVLYAFRGVVVPRYHFSYAKYQHGICKVTCF